MQNRGRPPKCASTEVASREALSQSEVSSGAAVQQTSSSTACAGLVPAQVSKAKRCRAVKTTSKKTMPGTPSRRFILSKVRMRTGADEQATILEVTTSVSGRKRGRPPRKPVIKTTEKSDTGRVAGRCDGRDESGPAASEVTTRRLPRRRDKSRNATSKVTKRWEIPSVSNRRWRVICRLVIVVVRCTEMIFLSFGRWQICITLVCFGSVIYSQVVPWTVCPEGKCFVASVVWR